MSLWRCVLWVYCSNLQIDLNGHKFAIYRIACCFCLKGSVLKYRVTMLGNFWRFWLVLFQFILLLSLLYNSKFTLLFQHGFSYFTSIWELWILYSKKCLVIPVCCLMDSTFKIHFSWHRYGRDIIFVVMLDLTMRTGTGQDHIDAFVPYFLINFPRSNECVQGRSPPFFFLFFFFFFCEANVI